MSYRQWSAQNRRRDAAEPAIIEALRAAGHRVDQVGGRSLPDLLVRPRGCQGGLCYGLEVKTGKGQRTKAQEQSDWPLVRTPDEALAAVGLAMWRVGGGL